VVQVQAILSHDLSETEIDRLVSYSAQFPDAVVPELMQAIERTPLTETRDKDRARKIADVIAYTGGRIAIESLFHLVDADQGLFGRSFLRMLDYSRGRGDTYGLVYEMLQRANDDLARSLANWVASTLDRGGPEELAFAKHVVSRHAGAPTAAEFNSDPLIKRLSPELTSRIRERVEVLGKRSKAQNDR
jgi:hypothetical protein